MKAHAVAHLMAAMHHHMAILATPHCTPMPIDLIELPEEVQQLILTNLCDLDRDPLLSQPRVGRGGSVIYHFDINAECERDEIKYG